MFPAWSLETIHDAPHHWLATQLLMDEIAAEVNAYHRDKAKP